MSVHEHKRHARTNLKVGVITASDTRTPDTDESGRLVRILFEGAGHQVCYYEIIPDDREKLSAAIVENLPNLDAIVINGGTGISARDGSAEVVKSLLDKELDGFGEIFRMLSFNEIGSAAIMSRAIAGVREGKLIIALPGSTDACKLAMNQLIIPEIGHIVSLLNQ